MATKDIIYNGVPFTRQIVCDGCDDVIKEEDCFGIVRVLKTGGDAEEQHYGSWTKHECWECAGIEVDPG